MKKGITLVALVVTIIILLILATVTISLILGDNSMFGRAAEGKTKTELTQVGERLQNAATAMLTDILAESVTQPTTAADLRAMLATNVSAADTAKLALPVVVGTTLSAGTGTPPGPVVFTYVNDGYTLTFTIDFNQRAAFYTVN